MEKKELAEKYRLYLVEEGYMPTVDTDGDVTFKKEGLIYVILIDSQDETYLRIASPNLWPIENTDERMRVLSACDAANSGTKVAKMFTVRNNVWANAEIFATDSESFKRLFPRMMAAMQLAMNTFIKEMTPTATASPAAPAAAAPASPAAPAAAAPA